jgi:hypothetical protein
VDKAAAAGASPIEADVPTDLLAGLLMEGAGAPLPISREPSLKTIYAVMAATSLLTFAALTAGYQLLFSHQLFA